MAAGAGVAGAALSGALKAANSGAAPAGTGYGYSPRFGNFYNNYHEHPQRVIWINDKIVQTGLVDQVTSIAPVEDPTPWIQSIHTDWHIQSIKSEYSHSTDTHPESMADMAELAVGYVLGAVDSVCRGDCKNSFCAIRPPGHHAVNSGWDGYCVYANIVIAAKYAMQQHGIERILIIDWDYHHGNSTEDLVCESKTDPLFPSGSIRFFETYRSIVTPSRCPYTPGYHPRSEDTTNTTNVAMGTEEYGRTNSEFERAFDEILMPIAESFKPQLVLISSGFDLKANDTHGDFLVTSRGISSLTKKAMDIADQYAGGKLVSMLEGGYADSENAYSANPDTFHGLSACAERHLATLVTGDLQPESTYYSTRVTRPAGIQAGEQVRFSGGVLRIETGNVEEVLVTNSAGRVVAQLTGSAVKSARVDLSRHVTGKGWYSVQVKYARRVRVFAWLFQG